MGAQIEASLTYVNRRRRRKDVTREIYQGSEGPEEGREESAGGPSHPMFHSRKVLELTSMAERAGLCSQRGVDLKLSLPAYQKVP